MVAVVFEGPASSSDGIACSQALSGVVEVEMVLIVRRPDDGSNTGWGSVPIEAPGVSPDNIVADAMPPNPSVDRLPSPFSRTT